MSSFDRVLLAVEGATASICSLIAVYLLVAKPSIGAAIGLLICVSALAFVLGQWDQEKTF